MLAREQSTLAGKTLRLIGNDALCERYRVALARFGCHDAKTVAQATERGLYRIAAQAGLVDAPPCRASLTKEQRHAASHQSARAVRAARRSRRRRSSACPLIAILRGVTPADAADHGRALYEAGFRIVEVPLNSPQPFDSIAAIRQALPADAIVGAGTVLHSSFVDEREGGGRRTDRDAAQRRRRRARRESAGLACAPGVATPNEAFLALKNGADVLKMFPAEQLGPPGGEGVARGDRGGRCRSCRSAASRRTTWGRS